MLIMRNFLFFSYYLKIALGDRWSILQQNCNSSINYSNNRQDFELEPFCQNFTQYVANLYTEVQTNSDFHSIDGIITPIDYDTFELCGAYNKIGEDLNLKVRSVSCQHQNFDFINKNHKLTDTFQEISDWLAKTLWNLKWLNPIIIIRSNDVIFHVSGT